MSTKVVTTLIRRVYTAAATAESVKGQQAAVASSGMKRAGAAVESASPAAGKEVFWMRDPKSGNWVPETHFDDVDAVDQRELLLPIKFKNVF